MNFKKSLPQESYILLMFWNVTQNSSIFEFQGLNSTTSSYISIICFKKLLSYELVHSRSTFMIPFHPKNDIDWYMSWCIFESTIQIMDCNNFVALTYEVHFEFIVSLFVILFFTIFSTCTLLLKNEYFPAFDYTFKVV